MDPFSRLKNATKFLAKFRKPSKEEETADHGTTDNNSSDQCTAVRLDGKEIWKGDKKSRSPKKGRDILGSTVKSQSKTYFQIEVKDRKYSDPDQYSIIGDIERRKRQSKTPEKTQIDGESNPILINPSLSLPTSSSYFLPSPLKNVFLP